ncbi:DMT family transporter [bacterium CPR1]|nr:DMT family transporter [bacterium CPR1]
MNPAAAWLLLALTGASLEPILVKIGYQMAVSPVQLLLIKNLVGALAILPLTRTFRWVGWRGMRKIVPVSLLLMLTFACNYLALMFLPAVAVITLVTTTPAVVALVNQRRGLDRLTFKFWLGFGLCFAGVLLTVGAFRVEAASLSPWWMLGLLASLVTIASSTVYRTRLETVMAEHRPVLVSTYIFLINGLVSLVVLAPLAGSIPPGALGIGLWTGLAAAVANIAFLSALHLVGSTNISIFNMLQRPLVIVAASILLKETMAPVQWLGVILVLAGVPLANVKRP